MNMHIFMNIFGNRSIGGKPNAGDNEVTLGQTVNKCSLQQSKDVIFILGHDHANKHGNEEVNYPPRPHENSPDISNLSICKI